jgi:hypothetical protein
VADHGYAAFAPADVKDARRGHPATSLAGYATERGLEWLDRRSAAGFSAAFPGFEEYRYNAVRGMLPGGRFGVLFHQLLEVPVTGSPNISGTLYGSKVKVKGRGWWWLPDRTDIPYIGQFLDTPTDPGEPDAFESHAVWIPTTTVAINVPEAALPFFLTRIDRRHHHAPFDFPHQERLADGWRLRAHGPVPDLDLDAVLARHADDPFFQILALRGTVIVRRNGYQTDIDALARDACAIADAFAAASPSHAQPFASALPAPRSHHPEVTPAWRDGYAKLAARLRLTEEDADDYQRAFPTLGVPGHAVAVMRGELAPGIHGRLVYSAERNLRAAERARGAVLLPATGDPTPPGGERHPGRQLVHEQRDGVAVLWSLRTAGMYREEQEDLIERALRFAADRLQV